VTGIGGAFLRAQDPAALAAWYAEHLGIPLEDFGGAVLTAEPGDITVWSLFRPDTDYFGPSGQQLHGRLPRPRPGHDARPAARCRRGRRSSGRGPGRGRFGWATDPQGNRFELWQPRG
jgi:hypothetical protein